MQLTFESLAELQDFVQWVQAERQAAPVEPSKTTIVVKDLPEVPVPEIYIEANPEEDSTIAPPLKLTGRKRRTKAEMEAARAAEIAAEEVPAVAAAVAESASIPAVAEGNAPPVQTVAVDKGDSAEFIKSRLAERPEVSQVEHLNLARTFIGKHGMEKYNASFPLAGLTPNVMGYSPADCATHAAALDFLSLE